MYKRKNQTEQEEPPQKRVRSANETEDFFLKLHELPEKAIECVLFNLSLKEALNLRLLNKSIKKTVDKCKVLWEEFIRVSVNLVNDREVKSLLNLMQHVPYITDFSLTCNSTLYEEYNFSDTSYSRPRYDNKNNVCEPNVFVELKNLHMNNLHLVNIFSHSCEILVISNFDEKLAKQIKDDMDKHSHAPHGWYIGLKLYSDTCINLIKLKRLVINSSIYDPTYGHLYSYNEPDGYACAEMTLDIIKKSKLDLKHLKVLFIAEYYADLGTILDCLKGLELDLLEVTGTRSIHQFDIKWRKKAPFTAKKVYLDCSVNIMHAILFHGINLSQIEELHLCDNCFYNEDEDAYRSLFRRMNNKLTSCKRFGITIDMDSIQEGKLKFPKGQLIDISFDCSFDMRSLNQFIRNFLSQPIYKNLEIIRFRVFFEPRDKTNESIFQSILEFVRKHFTSLKMIYIHLKTIKTDGQLKKQFLKLTSQDIDDFKISDLYA